MRDNWVYVGCTSGILRTPYSRKTLFTSIELELNIRSRVVGINPHSWFILNITQATTHTVFNNKVSHTVEKS